MLDKVRKYLGLATIEENVGIVLDLEKSIQDNKSNALNLSGEFLPVISKLDNNVEAMGIFCDISKSETKKMEGMFMLEKLKDKLSGIKSDYYSKIGELRKSNKSFNTKISRLMAKKSTNEAITLFKYKDSLKKSFNHITDEFLKGNVSDEVYSKSFITFKDKFGENIRDYSKFEIIQKAFNEGQITQDLFEKAAKSAQEKKVAQVMSKFKAGTLKSSSGKKVTDRSQATAIAMSEAGLSKSDDEGEKGVEKSDTEPTEAQKKAGNYKKEKRNVRGLVISIENKKGSTRSGKSKDGKEWKVVMSNDYGYFNRSLGKDGDHVDVFLSDKPEEGNIYVIDQSDTEGKFDEHKVMMGYKTEADALKNYKSSYEKGFKVKYSGITEVSEENFKKWLNTRGGGFQQKRKPFSELKKSDNVSDDHLKEMIEEHERLVKILAPLAGKYPKVKKEFDIQVKELKKYKEQLKEKAIDVINKAIEDGLVDEDILEKAKYTKRTGSPGNYKYVYEEDGVKFESKYEYIRDTNIENFISKKSLGSEFEITILMGGLENAFKEDNNIFSQKSMDSYFSKIKSKKINPELLTFVQEKINKELLDKKIKKKDEESVRVFKVNEKLYIADGNHKAAASLNRKDKNINVKIVDLTNLFNDDDFKWNIRDKLKRKKVEEFKKNFKKSIEDDLEKGRTGIYGDNATNRRLNRVGQKFGTKKQEEASGGKKTAKKEEPKGGEKQSIDEQAKTASGSSLTTASTESKDPEVRSAAHKELERREKEEKVQEEEPEKQEKVEEKPVEKEKKEPETKELLEKLISGDMDDSFWSEFLKLTPEEQKEITKLSKESRESKDKEVVEYSKQSFDYDNFINNRRGKNDLENYRVFTEHIESKPKDTFDEKTMKKYNQIKEKLEKVESNKKKEETKNEDKKKEDENKG